MAIDGHLMLFFNLPSENGTYLKQTNVNHKKEAVDPIIIQINEIFIFPAKISEKLIN